MHRNIKTSSARSRQSDIKTTTPSSSYAFAAIQQQVERELGKPLNVAFKSFEQEPFAAASIGQVHKAVLPSGEQVVVKVQYPGVDEACESDLKQVRLALRLMGVLKIDKSCKISFCRDSR